MQTIKLSKRQLDNLVRYDVPKEVTNTEGVIYYLKTGIKKIDKENLLFKKLFINHDYIDETYKEEVDNYLYHSSSMSNKFYTISRLNDFQRSMSIEELVIPKHQVTFRNDIIGFTVPEIKDSRSLQAILNDSKVDPIEKIDYLKQVGETLKKINHLRLYDINFYIHDLHEGNILVTNRDKKIHFVDLDSASFSTEHALPSKPLLCDKKLKDYSKYKYNRVHIPYPGVEQDLYCYIIMILKTLYHEDITKISKEEFDKYLAYLASLGFNADLIRSFSLIYSDTPNINPVDYLDGLEISQIAQSSNMVYEIKKKKHLI